MQLIAGTDKNGTCVVASTGVAAAAAVASLSCCSMLALQVDCWHVLTRSAGGSDSLLLELVSPLSV
jgi:hypothetical protein